MNKREKIKEFKSAMEDVVQALEEADYILEGSAPVQDLIGEVDKTTAQVVAAIKRS